MPDTKKKDKNSKENISRKDNEHQKPDQSKIDRQQKDEEMP